MIPIAGVMTPCYGRIMTENAGDRLAAAVYDAWRNNGHQLAPAIRWVSEKHPDALIREAATFDFVVETLDAYVTARWREAQQATA